MVRGVLLSRNSEMLKPFRSFGCALFLFCLSQCAWAATGTLLPHSVGYPRLVRLTYGPAASNGWIVASTTGKLFLSKDDGKTFSPISDAPVRDGSRLRCCETLYELPRAIGSLPAGTLLYSATYSVGSRRLRHRHRPLLDFQICGSRVFRRSRFTQSPIKAQIGPYLSTPVMGRGEKGTGGLWQ